MSVSYRFDAFTYHTSRLYTSNIVILLTQRLAVKVLFDFEVVGNHPPVEDAPLYSLIREFFVRKFEPLDQEIQQYLPQNDVPTVVISMHDDILSTIPYNIPSQLFDRLNQCVSPAEFDAFQDTMIAMNKKKKNFNKD